MLGNVLQKARCHRTADRSVICLLATHLMIDRDDDTACQIARLRHRKFASDHKPHRAANLALPASRTRNRLWDAICCEAQGIRCNIGRNSTCFRTRGRTYVVQQCCHIAVFPLSIECTAVGIPAARTSTPEAIEPCALPAGSGCPVRGSAFGDRIGAVACHPFQCTDPSIPVAEVCRIA